LTTDLTPPLVSAVVPTRNRPDLVCRAVRSALNQTYPNFEVVVVVDGPDPATVAALEELRNPCVRIIALSENVGGSEARNIGAREARGEWVALLDDDDEWMPEKLEKQIQSVLSSNGSILFSATQYYDRQDGRVATRPASFPGQNDHISEYLFCRLDRFGRRLTFLQTSTWVIRRDFLVEHPFTPRLRRNQDTDWLLRYFPLAAEQSRFLAEPLASFDACQNIRRISTALDWEYTYSWATRNKDLFTSKAFAFFLALVCGRDIALQRAGMRALGKIWKSCSMRARLLPQVQFCFGKRLAQHIVNTTRAAVAQP
jgi:glycosyltransferase involved in cell wall biosynthesis